MSISYSLNFDTVMPPERMSDLLAQIGSLTRTDDLDFEGQGVTVGVGRISRLGREVLKEEFGVRAAVNVVMHLVPSEGYEEGKANVASIVATLLRRTKDDVVVLRNNEEIVLRRTGGRTMLGDDYGAWLSSNLDVAGIRYEPHAVMTPAA